MVTVTTYNIYVSGQLPNPQLSGDIDSKTHQITINPAGSAMIGISVAGLTDKSGEPVTLSEEPVVFPAGEQPAFVSWARLSPTYLLLTNLNWNQECTQFKIKLAGGGVFSPEAGVLVLPGIDPTIVNTYIPPPTPMVPLQPVIPGRPVAPACPEGPQPQRIRDEAGTERRIA
jgi:hypothetical protein